MKTTEIRQLGESDTYIRVRYGMHYIKGNPGPYFSITADLLERYRRGAHHPCDCVEDGWAMVGGGCCHDDIRRAFPELADLIKWHLCWEDGTPMHYIANAEWWAKLHREVWDSGVPGKSALDVLKDHILYGETPLDVPDKLSSDRPPQSFTSWLERRIPFLTESFRRAMAKHGVDMVAVPA